MGVDPAKDLHFLSFAEFGLDLYSNAVVVSQKMMKTYPDKVAGLVRAINKGMQDVLADPELAITALKKREPLIKEPIERDRFKTVFDLLVFSDEMKRVGLGAVDPDRLTRSIKLVAKAYGLPIAPHSKAVFDGSFLPPLEARMVAVN